MRKKIGKILRQLCEQFEIELIEGTAVAAHVHFCLAFRPKYFGSEKELYGGPLLGTRVLCKYGWFR